MADLWLKVRTLSLDVSLVGYPVYLAIKLSGTQVTHAQYTSTFVLYNFNSTEFE